jgi:hypothetical protein
MIHFSCKWCGKRYRASARHVGQADACKECGRPVYVPRKSSASAPTLQFACPRCGKRYRTHPRYAGVKQACRGCGEMIVAPTPVRANPVPPASDKPEANAAFEAERAEQARKLAELEAFLDVPPFELLPTADDLPEASLLEDDEGNDEEAAGPPPVALLVPPPPVAAIVPPPPLGVFPPTAAPALVTLPASPPEPAIERGEAALPPPESASAEPAPSPPAPEPPPLKKGCSYCGAEGSYNLHSRSPLGVLGMLLGSAGGLAALCFVEQDWRYGIAAGVGFAFAVGGAFLKRWTVICAGCERRRY